MILIIKHAENEGPGSIEEFFKNTAWDLKTIELSKGEKLPKDLEDIEAVISMGGPMNVYEEDKYPYLKEEDAFLKNVVKKKMPFLGICLGSQLLAKAAGAGVKKSPEKEIGWYEVCLTEDGKRDKLFNNAPSILNVFQWHEDMFELPKDGALLATSSHCPHQAFRIGKNAYGLQFHIESTPDMVESWMENKTDLDDVNIMLDTYRQRETFEKVANLIYLNFARIIEL